MLQGSWEAKALSVAVELDMFTMVSKGTNTVEKLAQETEADQRALGMLVNACRASGLLVGKDDSLRNSPEAERYLVSGKEGFVGDFIVLVGSEYYDIWRSLKEVVVTGRPVREDRKVRLSNPRYAEHYLNAMRGITHEHSQGLAKSLDLEGKRAVLDVGGGHGTYSVAIGKANPMAKVTIFDSPYSCERVKPYLDQQGAKNVKTEGGDFVMGGIPRGSDVVMLSHVLQSMDPPRCEALLTKAFDALPKGGMIVINEFRLDGAVFSGLMAINSFMLSDGGSLYPVSLITEWLENVGFTGVKLLKTTRELIVSLTAKKV